MRAPRGLRGASDPGAPPTPRRLRPRGLGVRAVVPWILILILVSGGVDTQGVGGGVDTQGVGGGVDTQGVGGGVDTQGVGGVVDTRTPRINATT
jgi:hypothetical protein